jgi:hypothetical protein
MRVGIPGRCIKPIHLTVLPMVQSEVARCDGEKTVRNCDRSDGLFLVSGRRSIRIKEARADSVLAQPQNLGRNAKAYRAATAVVFQYVSSHRLKVWVSGYSRRTSSMLK